jgi:hypothetical protein
MRTNYHHLEVWVESEQAQKFTAGIAASTNDCRFHRIKISTPSIFMQANA